MDKHLVINLYHLVTSQSPSGTLEDMMRIITKRVIAMEYNYTALELQVQKYEKEIRNHIRKQQEIRIVADQLQSKIQLLQLEKATIIDEAAKTLSLFKQQCNNQLKCGSPRYKTLNITRRTSRNLEVYNRNTHSQDQNKRKSSFQQYLQYRQNSQQHNKEYSTRNQLQSLNTTFAYCDQISKMKTQLRYQPKLHLTLNGNQNQTEMTQYLESEI